MAFLTIVVIVGLVTTEVYAVLSGYIELNQVIPTFLLQTVLLGLFGFGYFGTGEKFINSND